jgi:hypothetical protein
MIEGWALDITTRNREHYYRNGISLCKKATLKDHMKINGSELGSKWCGQCAVCCKKQRESKQSS